MPEPTPRRKAPAPAPEPRRVAPAAPVELPDPAAYYANASSTLERLIGQKHDEKYIDPQTGRECTANSCLSFATTALEQATGSQQPRVKANLYNPEFTRTSEQQGWVRIPLKHAKAGDRLQYWNAEGNAANGVDRTADLGGRQYIQGKYPSHMTVFGGWGDNYDAQGRRSAYLYQDGHQFENADKAKLPVGDDSYVAYRYVGRPKPQVDTQPTPRRAVATR